ARLTDSRRLTGANLHWDLPSAIIDVDCPEGRQSLLDAWQSSARSLLEAVGHPSAQLTYRYFDGGLSLLISAPIDALYSMCELNELAFTTALSSIEAQRPVNPESGLARLRDEFAAERKPPLLAMQAAAARHGVPFLWDDDEVSVGHGATSCCWPAGGIPDPSAVEWGDIKAIPVALVTGTNGKSTTVRMAATIIAEAGLAAGLTSTDWIRVGDQVLDTGDYSGTGGARTLLRDSRTQVAVLETARGGLLRRGLGVERASAALITNVAADHLGEYGINTVPELIEAKFIVHRALGPGAPLILNADDPGIVSHASTIDSDIRWFSLDPSNPVLASGAHGQVIHARLEDRQLVLHGSSGEKLAVALKDVPATLGGAARYNISNALGAMLLCDALGIEHASIARGLRRFRGDDNDNPGRGNWFEGRGVRVLVDFAHNEHGMRALAQMVLVLPANRKVVLMGQAGDRSNDEIRAMAGAACSMAPDQVLACALPGYERGRPQSEVQQVIRDSALQSGMRPAQIIDFDSPVEATQHALEHSAAGDLLVLLALTQREEVLELIREFSSG
ncbi:MAG: Mur ligase, partial [Xanthomonadales bacterium]|nr:Mur ligase [Xanthomonadales bacterium]